MIRRQKGRGASRIGLPAALTAAVVASCSVSDRAAAEPFERIATTTLRNICENRVDPNFGGGSQTFRLSAEMLVGCGNLPSTLFAGTSSAGPSGAGTLAIEQRLQSVRESEEERRMGRRAHGLYAFAGRGEGADFAQRAPSATIEKPLADVLIDYGKGLSGFVSAGAAVVHHRSSRFEDGYRAEVPNVTVGADYRLADEVLVGFAFSYANFNATYDDGGGTNRDSYGPLLYATVFPYTGVFADVVIGYSRHDNFDRRHIDPARVDPPPVDFNATADYTTDQYAGSVLAGYDHRIGDVMVGPRAGVGVTHWRTDSVRENADSGFDLKYGSLDRTSVQSSLGARAAVLLDSPHGVLQPWLGAAWVHEFADNARNVKARYLDATPSPNFTFQREGPDRNWAEIDVGLTALLPNGLQPFASFSTVQGNSNFVIYGGTAGVRLSF
jgi:uncharacterized protein YhjY with autotransporter beta-barrel domain